MAEISAMQCRDFGMISLCIGFCALCSCSLVCFQGGRIEKLNCGLEGLSVFIKMCRVTT